MKISELTTKSFLGKNDIPANSYVLVNYAEGANDTPVTYKATIEELGNAIAKDLQLVSTYNGNLIKSGINSQNNAYTSSTMGEPMYVSDSNGINITHENGDKVSGIVLYDDTQAAGEELGYFSGTTANSWTPISVGGGGGSSSGSPLFYDKSGDYITFMDANGHDLEIEPPAKITVSESIYNYELYAGGVAAIEDSSGYDVVILGRPLFYNDTTHKVGYYTSQGSFTEVTL